MFSPDRKIPNTFLAAAMLVSSIGCIAPPSKDGRLQNSTEASSKLNDFQEKGCGMGVSTLVPKNWVITDAPITANLPRCFIAPNKVEEEDELRVGMVIVRIQTPFPDPKDYARQIVTQASNNRLPIAGSFNERRIGSLTVIETKATDRGNNRLSDVWEIVVVKDGDTRVFRAWFIEPKTAQSQNYNAYGDKMLKGIKVNGSPTR